jgi:hypothetical protein
MHKEVMLDIMGTKIDSLDKCLDRFEAKIKDKNIEIEKLESVLQQPDKKDLLDSIARKIKNICSPIEKKFPKGIEEDVAENRVLIDEVELYQKELNDPVRESVESLSSTIIDELYKKAVKAPKHPSPKKQFTRKHIFTSKENKKNKLNKSSKNPISIKKIEPEQPVKQASVKKANAKMLAMENKVYSGLNKGFKQMDSIIRSVNI